MTIKLKNNVVGYLATAINASDTGIVLQSGNGANFPSLGAGEYFYATLVSSGGTLEVVKATARSGDSMTVVRAQDGSSAASFAAGSRVEMRVNAQSVLDVVDQVTASQVGFTPTGGIAATDVQAALAEVDSEKIAFTRLDDSDGSSLMGFLQAGTGAVATTVQAKLRESVSIFDFMSAALIADVQAGTLLLDCTGAFTAALAASKNIYFPPGKYRFNSTITITGARGLTLRGAACALLAGGTGYTGTTELYFSNAASGSNGIVITDFTGVTISDMSIVMRRSGVGAGFALFMYNGHDFSLQNLKVDTAVNASGGGVKLGDGSPAVAAFVGNLRNVKCIVDGGKGAGIYQHVGTSTTAENCYIIGGYWLMSGMEYCSLVSCAVDVSSSFGYIINGSRGIGLYACGCEGATKGAFYLSTGSYNIHIDTPTGSSNNTSADTLIGDLVYLDNSAGAVGNVTITNPTSLTPNAATTSNIASNVGGGHTEIYNTSVTGLSLGIGGNGDWIREKVTVTGFWDQFTTWTPTLAGWTNVGSPTVVGKYKRVGKIVTFYVTVTPSGGGSISSTVVTSTITGFPWGTVTIGSATMTDGNAVSYGACVVSSTGIIYPQTSGVLTVSLNFVGTVILP